ncbi:UDP-glucose 4-epimerase [Novosphingobium sp. PhB165]|nr:UDP-glucose 4-epimerase [Novosphingobium sp. PhB165]
MRKSVSLVTGAAGFIGSHLSARLLAEGDEVHVLVRPTTSLARLSAIAGNLTIHTSDLRDREATRAQIAAIAPERVFHLAAETRLPPEPSFERARAAIAFYIEPTLNLVEALADLSAPPSVVVRTGTIAEYGDADLPYGEASRPHPLSPYGAGMLATAQYLAMLAPTVPFPVITARLALCYGPGQSREFLVPALIDAAITGRPITVRRPGDRRDLLHVADVVDALLQIAELASGDCTLVNVASGEAPTMGEVADRIVAMTGCDPALVTRLDPLPGDSPVEMRSTTERARVRFGWERRIGLEEGLRQTIAAEQLMRSMAG